MLQHFLHHTLNLPYPVAVWLTSFCDTLYAIVVTPLGALIAVIFLMTGYLRFGVTSVAILSAVASFALVQMRLQALSHFSDELRTHHAILVFSAVLALCFAASFIGRKMRPRYI